MLPGAADMHADIPSLLSFALDLAREADEITMRYFRRSLEVLVKDDGTLVTAADREAERHLRDRIRTRYPSHSILGEEEGWSVGREGHGTWVVDPVDGTHNFARDVPVWATLVAFERDGRAEVGVVSAPALGVRWWAARGFGAHRCELGREPRQARRIYVSDRIRVEDSVVLYGSYADTVDAWPGVDALLRKAWRTRGFGDFWGHCLVAEGAAEVMLEPAVAPWDLAAIQVLVEEAGGRLTDLRGRSTTHSGHCISSNGLLHPLVLSTLRKAESVPAVVREDAVRAPLRKAAEPVPGGRGESAVEEPAPQALA